MKIKLEYIIIMVLIGLLALSWGRKPEIREKVVVKDTVIYVKVLDLDTVFLPKLITQVKTDTVLQVRRDTVFVYNDYFLERTYKDTLKDDERQFVYLESTVTRNSLVYNRFVSNCKVMDKTVINEVYKERAHVYIGGSLTTNGNLFFDLSYKTPNKGLYSFGYDPFQRHFKINAAFRIF